MVSFDWTAFYEIAFSQWQLYGLVFLLGSLTVATWSDLKHMSAQTEFLEIWLLVVAVFAIVDAYEVYDGGPVGNYLLKWGLIIVFGLISNEHFGILFRVARADIFACAAVMSILPPLVIIVFIISLKVLDVLMRPFLKGFFGSRSAYPFLPVMYWPTVGVFVVGLWMGGQIAL